MSCARSSGRARLGVRRVAKLAALCRALLGKYIATHSRDALDCLRSAAGARERHIFRRGLA